MTSLIQIWRGWVRYIINTQDFKIDLNKRRTYLNSLHCPIDGKQDYLLY